MLASEILDHYGDGKEEHRLTRSLGRLEWIRTWEIMGAICPSRRRACSMWAAEPAFMRFRSCGRGYRVQLIDAVPLHVERARELSKASKTPLSSADVGDARGLELPDTTFDVVLLSARCIT